MTFHMLSIRDMDVQIVMSIKDIRFWTDVDTDVRMRGMWRQDVHATRKLSWGMCVTAGGVVHVC